MKTKEVVETKNEANTPTKLPRGQRLLSLLYSGATLGTAIAMFVAMRRPKLPSGAAE